MERIGNSMGGWSVGQRLLYGFLGLGMLCLSAVGLLAGVIPGEGPWSRLALDMRQMVLAPTLTSTPSATPTPTETPTPTVTPMPTTTPTPSAAPTLTATSSVTITPSATPWPTATAAPTSTATPKPLPTPDGKARALAVPILMYHYISTPPANADAVRRDLSVPPARFEEHLRYLRNAGYQAISLYDLILALQTGHALPAKPIILTFDDGYRDAYTEALPLLRRYGFTGTFFLITSLVEEEHPAYLTWAQAAEMQAVGMDMEVHGHTHPDLRLQSQAHILWEVLRSRELIEDRLHKGVRFFCYPSGKYDVRVIQTLRSAHYWGAVSLHAGIVQCATQPFELTRVRMHGHYTTENLAQVLETYQRAAQGRSACTTTR